MTTEQIKQLQSDRDRWRNLALEYSKCLKETMELMEEWKKMYREVTKQ